MALELCSEFRIPWYTKWFNWNDCDDMLFSDRLLNKNSMFENLIYHTTQTYIATRSF